MEARRLGDVRGQRQRLRGERAAELYAIDEATPLWHRSQLVGPFRNSRLAAVSAVLPPERLAAALERGRGLERWATARALLVELEALGWEGAAKARGREA